MTYISEQNSAELRAHIRRLQKMPGWSDAVTDRLFKEIVEQDARIKKIEQEARRYAEMYSQSSEGRNTFVIFADWVAGFALTSQQCNPTGE